MVKPREGKEEQIGRLLREGRTPAELVHEGWVRSSVYKVAKRLRTWGTPQEPGATQAEIADDAVEGDPDVLDLRKALRKAELELQIAEIKGTPMLEARVSELEEVMREVGEDLENAMSAGHRLEGRMNGLLFSGLRENFSCACGTKGFVAAGVVCTACERETRYGWWPERSG